MYRRHNGIAIDSYKYKECTFHASVSAYGFTVSLGGFRTFTDAARYATDMRRFLSTL